jgi:hypothetical protein
MWAALHVAALLAFRDWRILLIGLLAYPFWVDAVGGNVIIFVVLAAWWALRGSPTGTFAYLALCLLIPRPLMVPVAVWLLWQRPTWRLPFALMIVVNAVLLAWTGLLPDWLGAVELELDHFRNLAPSRWLGNAWLLIAWPLAAWLTLKGRLGLASLAASPYLFPYYLLFGLLELRQRPRIEAGTAETDPRHAHDGADGLRGIAAGEHP